MIRNKVEGLRLLRVERLRGLRLLRVVTQGLGLGNHPQQSQPLNNLNYPPLNDTSAIIVA